MEEKSSFQQLNTLPSLDATLLIKSLNSINKAFFKNKIRASILWDVPQGLITIETGTPTYTPCPNSQDAQSFEDAKRALANNHPLQAIQKLQPLADKGHPESEFLLSHLLKRTQGDWQRYAKAYNNHLKSEQLSPAACYYPETQSIAIHPHLKERKAPQFVLRYLIYHECCHQILQTDCSNPHPRHFMDMEEKAPFRQKAIAWLQKEGFPTLNNNL